MKKEIDLEFLKRLAKEIDVKMTKKSADMPYLTGQKDMLKSIGLRLFGKYL